MRYIMPVLLVLLLPASIFAEAVSEAASEAPSFDPSELGGWQSILYLVITAAIAYGLKLWRNRTKSAEQVDVSVTDKNLLENRELLLSRVEATAMRVADTWSQDDLPAVLIDALNGDGEFNWKLHFTQGFRSVRTEVISCFKSEGIDLVARLGQDRLNGIIKSAILKAVKYLPDRISAFLPEALVEPFASLISKVIINRTADWIPSNGN